MKFNGKTLIIIGTILFIFQIANFFSVDSITPQLERAQILAAISSLIIILIGFLFKEFEPLAGEKANLKGENTFFFDKTIPSEVINELADTRPVGSGHELTKVSENIDDEDF